jgi:hypothetical protein
LTEPFSDQFFSVFNFLSSIFFQFNIKA